MYGIPVAEGVGAGTAEFANTHAQHQQAAQEPAAGFSSFLSPIGAPGLALNQAKVQIPQQEYQMAIPGLGANVSVGPGNTMHLRSQSQVVTANNVPQQQQIQQQTQQQAQKQPKNPAMQKAPYQHRVTSTKKVAPSVASGGVPEATPQYHLLASSPPVTMPGPRHILVVIDLNGTLVYRPSRKTPRYFVPRPYADQFLRYCVDTFRVVVWSSAKPVNVESMCQRLLAPPHPQASQANGSQDNNNSNVVNNTANNNATTGSTTAELMASTRAAPTTGYLVAVWARDRFGLSPQDYNLKVQCYKRLTRLWADPLIQASHPEYAAGGRWDQTNTVLVDDSVEKARSEPYNFVEVPEFVGGGGGSGAKQGRDCVLPQVHDYLNRLCFQSNVSSYIRQHPFKPDPEYKMQ